MELADRLCDTVAFISEGKVEAIDSPNALKLKYGTKQVKIDYLDNNKEKSSIIPLEDKEKISDFLMNHEVLKMHTSEATLEDIFIKVTGKELI
jgi:fluoroquinolone transport system ATP-binding protein